MSPYVCHLTHKLHACKRSVCVCVRVCMGVCLRVSLSLQETYDHASFRNKTLLTCSSFIFYVVLRLCFHCWNLLGCFCWLVANVNSTVAMDLNSFTATYTGLYLGMQLICMLKVQHLSVRCLVRWGKKKKIHVRSPAANFVVIHVLKFVSPAATNNRQ